MKRKIRELDGVDTKDWVKRYVAAMKEAKQIWKQFGKNPVQYTTNCVGCSGS